MIVPTEPLAYSSIPGLVNYYTRANQYFIRRYGLNFGAGVINDGSGQDSYNSFSEFIVALTSYNYSDALRINTDYSKITGSQVLHVVVSFGMMSLSDSIPYIANVYILGNSTD